jgi:hypothetical protein
MFLSAVSFLTLCYNHGHETRPIWRRWQPYSCYIIMCRLFFQWSVFSNLPIFVGAGNQNRTSENIVQIQFMVFFFFEFIAPCSRWVPRRFGEVYTEPLGVSSRFPVTLTSLFSPTCPHNQHITFFPSMSALTWTRFSHHEDGGSTLLRNVWTLTYYTAPKPKIRPLTDQEIAMKTY